ncbi:MAG: ERAP1-like C-terminal domain-containing protein, partial [Proteobacteria bacterium]|nr:ERAP1-like C-terminal domain-containing protein [Pseudomonadota bacterium]
KIGAQWRPDLGLEASRIDEAFDAMNDDALGHGRPIHQVITENTQIVSAFDDITYKKGAQVLSMFENYLGHDRFQKGVRLHLERYRYGSATADDFFRSLGEAASDPMIVPALRTFTDQTGIPVVKVIETPDGVTLEQTRYRPLGIDSVTAQTWMIPMCLTRAGDRACTMLASAKASVPALPGDAALTPNAGGSGYYRFSLDGPGWDRLMSAAGTLPGREAMVAADSLWADFAAGRASFQSVVTGARALSANPERLAALALAYRLADLANSVLTVEQIPRYRALVRSIYEPRLSAIGLDPRVGAHAAEPMATQALRQSLVPIVALEARPPDLRARLAVAAVAYLNGDTLALDPAFRVTAFIVAVQDRGAPFMAQLKDALVASTDPLFRQDASGALGSVDTPELATAALDLAWSPGMQTPETLTIVMGPAGSVGGRATVVEFVDKNFARVVDLFPGYERQGVLAIFAGECADGDVARLDALIQPRLKMIGAGELELAQTRERIELCTALRRAKGTEIAEVLAR